MPPQLTIHRLFQSDFYEIRNWTYDLMSGDKAYDGCNDCLCVVYVKKGNFSFDLSHFKHDLLSGYLVIEKPGYDYQFRPSLGETSILNFTDEFYRRFVDEFQLSRNFFFSNPNILSLMLRADPVIEYLHHRVTRGAMHLGKLEIDNHVMELLKTIVGNLSNTKYDDDHIDTSTAHYRRATVEMAKDYINEHFGTDISLQELSTYCHTSPFHFSRIFKKFTGWSPYQYLQQVRLKHGEMLLKNTNFPITDVAMYSGFNSVEYFATAFGRRYGMNPSSYRFKV